MKAAPVGKQRVLRRWAGHAWHVLVHGGRVKLGH